MSTLRDAVARLFRMSPEGRVVLATRNARSSFAERIRSGADLLHPLPDTSGPVAVLGLQASVTADERSLGPARAAGRAVHRLSRAQRRRRHRIERLQARLSGEQFTARLRAATDYERGSALLGHLSVWMSAAPVFALGAAMTLNDPGFILMTLRTAFDVPTTTGLLDVRNPDLVVALAAALAVTTVLLAGAHFVGKALGTILFRPHLARSDTAAGEGSLFPGIVTSRRLMDTRSAAIVAVIGVIPIAWFMLLLHQFAVSRFEGDLAAAITGSGAQTWVVWSITMLPLVVLAFQTVGAAPQLEQARRASTWSRRFRLRQWIDICTDQRHRMQEEDLRGRARERIALLADVLADVGKRTDAEAYAARIATGAVDVTAIAQAFRGPSAGGCPPLDVSGSCAGRFLPGMDDVPNRVRIVLTEWTDLESEDPSSQAAVLWQQARAAAGRPVPRVSNERRNGIGASPQAGRDAPPIDLTDPQFSFSPGSSPEQQR